MVLARVSHTPWSCGTRVPGAGMSVPEIPPFGTQGGSQPLAQGKWCCLPGMECAAAWPLYTACEVQRSVRGRSPWLLEAPLPPGGAKGLQLGSL